MRDVVDFYRGRPVLGTFLALLGLGLAVLTAVVGSLERPVAAVALALMLGLVLGGAIAAAQGDQGDDERDDW